MERQPPSSWLQKKLLFTQLILYTVRLYWDVIHRSIVIIYNRYRYPKTKSSDLTDSAADAEAASHSIIIIGGSFAGYFAAHLIATSLPPNSPYRVIVIEPNSHFHFTWVLPRFCVVAKHEHKAFIPYGPYLAGTSVRWIKDRVSLVDRTTVTLRDSGEKLPYEFLVVSTGSDGGGGLPSRVGAESKRDGLELLRKMQQRIADAKRIVVVGGGAVGVEIATDAKATYPHKAIVLVHSREAVMHRFGPELQHAALEGLQNLGVDVILGERVMSEDDEEGYVMLRSGRKVECDLIVKCGGQKPASQILAELTPSTVSESGYLRVKPTMQILDDTLPNIYACGDVADTGISNANSRAAMQQAKIAADNIVLATTGKQPRYKYKPHWAESVIKLTLGLDKSVTHFGNEKTELLFPAVEEKIELMSADSWRHWGVTPFEDKLFSDNDTSENGMGKALE